MANKAEDDREEGEIVDDDLEDISDNPIIETSFTGKCVSPIEHLRAISLSSLSEEEKATPQRIKKRRRSKRESKHFKKRKNHHRRPSHYSDSDSSGIEICGVVSNPFKAAVLRVDTEDCPKNNSLQTRLKAMTQKGEIKPNYTNSEVSSHDARSETDADIQKQPETADINKESDEDLDKELVQLRLEALKTAFINKLGSRQKGKKDVTNAKDVDSENLIADETEVNKENTLVINNNIDEHKKSVERSENTNDTTLPEEDPDILRAELLASMAKKIIGDKPEPSPTNIKLRINSSITKTFINKIPAVKTKTNFKINRVVKNNLVTIVNQPKPPLKLPEAKPLIINVNGEESDSDDEIKRPIKKDINTLSIENTVEQFLKEQRAKVEAENQRKLLNSKKFSSARPNPATQLERTDVKPALKTLPKLNVSINNNKTPVRLKKSPTIEKSAVKLLPKSKQIEYQRLLLKLKTAERKTRVRRNSVKGNGDISKNSPLQKSNTIKNKFNKSKLATTSNRSFTALDRKTEALKFHKTLKEMQIEKNGRLQIQDKYRVLTPLMRKINEASKERKKCDQDVKRLLEELTQAKMKQAKSQENFTATIKQLYLQKEKIDISHSKQLSSKKVVSNPGNSKKPLNLCKNSSTTVAPPQPLPDRSEIEKEKPEVQKEPSTNIEVNFGDPNDIDLIINKQNDKLPKYVSPLDTARTEHMDPFSIMCPFEIDGMCRDPECTYKHYSR